MLQLVWSSLSSLLCHCFPRLASSLPFLLSPSLAAGAVLAIEFLYCSMGSWRDREWAALLFLWSCYSISHHCQQRTAVWVQSSPVWNGKGDYLVVVSTETTLYCSLCYRVEVLLYVGGVPNLMGKSDELIYGGWVNEEGDLALGLWNTTTISP